VSHKFTSSSSFTYLEIVVSLDLYNEEEKNKVRADLVQYLVCKNLQDTHRLSQLVGIVVPLAWSALMM
jgi:hypothetical protein